MTPAGTATVTVYAKHSRLRIALAKALCRLHLISFDTAKALMLSGVWIRIGRNGKWERPRP